MTLGLTLALLPLVEGAKGWLAGVLETFGRVPLFYYMLHIPLIHLAAIAVSLIRTGAVTSVIVRESSAQPRSSARGISMEPAAALSRLGGRRRDTLLPVPVVRGIEGKEQEHVALLSVTAL
jgi:hypothetical protein